MATDTKRGRRTSAPATSARRSPLVYTVKEAAQLMRVSETTLRDAMAKGVVPYVRFGKQTIRIPAAQFHRWLDSIGVAS